MASGFSRSGIGGGSLGSFNALLGMAQSAAQKATRALLDAYSSHTQSSNKNAAQVGQLAKAQKQSFKGFEKSLSSVFSLISGAKKAMDFAAPGVADRSFNVWARDVQQGINNLTGGAALDMSARAAAEGGAEQAVKDYYMRIARGGNLASNEKLKEWVDRSSEVLLRGERAGVQFDAAMSEREKAKRGGRMMIEQMRDMARDAFMGPFRSSGNLWE
jgi:hypothetical protein